MGEKKLITMSIFDKINDHQKFAESILEQIQKLPFGSLPKKELELVILHSLILSLEDKKTNPYEKVNNHFSDWKDLHGIQFCFHQQSYKSPVC